MTQLGQAIIAQAVEWTRRSCYETISNGGNCIDDLQKAYHLSARREPYCAKFAWVCVEAACQTLGIPNLLPKTAGARDMRDRSKSVLRVDSRMEPGAVFYRYSSAAASGHIGVVLGWDDQHMFTAEGNRGDRIDLFSATLSEVSDPKNGYSFIHTEAMPGGDTPVVSGMAHAGVPVPLALLFAGGLAFYTYRQGIWG